MPLSRSNSLTLTQPFPLRINYNHFQAPQIQRNLMSTYALFKQNLPELQKQITYFSLAFNEEVVALCWNK